MTNKLVPAEEILPKESVEPPKLFDEDSGELDYYELILRMAERTAKDVDNV